MPEITTPLIEPVHTEDMQEIITAVPGWILRWGTTVILLILITTIFLAGIIKYPDIVKLELRINSTNSPQKVDTNQDLFHINSKSGDFFGEMNIPQKSIGKVKEGQKVLIKLKRFPYEEYGMLIGYVKRIADVTYSDSTFVSQVSLDLTSASNLRKRIRLKHGMTADAEIITQNTTLLQRLSRSVFKELN